MAKNAEDARAEGFKRGMAGKKDAAGMTQGWTDDKAAANARSDGFAKGNRKRSRRADAEKRAKDKG